MAQRLVIEKNLEQMLRDGWKKVLKDGKEVKKGALILLERKDPNPLPTEQLAMEPKFKTKRKPKVK